MSETLTLDLAGIVRESIVDGPGIRFVVFCQGCPHNCEGCHNPATHEFGAGKETAVERILAEIDKDPLLDGVTLSGGEPFCQPVPMAAIARGVKERGKNVFAFTGFTYEELEPASITELFKNAAGKSTPATGAEYAAFKTYMQGKIASILTPIE